MPVGKAEPQAGGSYRLEADFVAVMQFEDGRCLFTDTETDETFTLPKLFGHSAKPDGAYVVDLQDADELALLTDESIGKELSVEIVGWYREEEGYGRAEANQRYVLGDQSYQFEVVFSSGSCVLEMDDESIMMKKGQPLYTPDRSALSEENSIEGLYLGKVDGEGILMVVSAIGSGFFGFEFLTGEGREDFGTGVVNTEDGKRIVRAEDYQFICDAKGVMFIDETYGDQAAFEKITQSEGESGVRGCHGYGSGTIRGYVQRQW